MRSDDLLQWEALGDLGAQAAAREAEADGPGWGEQRFRAMRVVDRRCSENDDCDVYASRERMDGHLRTVERFYDRFGEGDLAGAVAMFAATVQITDPGLGKVEGLDALRSYLAGLKEWVPDARALVERVFEVEDTVVVEGRFIATSMGTIAGGGERRPSSGVTVDLAFADFARIRGDRIVEYRTYYDQVSLLTQLGQME